MNTHRLTAADADQTAARELWRIPAQPAAALRLLTGQSDTTPTRKASTT